MNGNDEKARSIHFTEDGAAKMRARIAARSMPEGDCRVWTGGRADNGYGVTGGALSGSRRRLYVHRAAWAAEHGELPDGLIVRHSCDNRPCVKVEHLLTGTTADNNADTLARWAQPIAYGSWTGQKGVKHRSAKLDPEKVREIRRRSAAGETLRALSEAFGVAGPNIWAVVHRKSWSEVE